MKTARKVKPDFPQPSGKLLFVDEAHYLLGDMSESQSYMKIHDRKVVFVTQAVIKKNSGKRRVYISYSRLADGSPTRRVPSKFVPAQAIRRQGVDQ